ncbi:MAG: AAA family ATPase [Pirellulales bacterium]|nr:AAA family ATPase [Pirellulales bacterium]
MYENYWELTCQPFAERNGLDLYFPAESHQGALLKLRYAIQQGAGGTALVGPPGVGKSLLIELLKAHLEADNQPVAQVSFPLLPAADLLAYLAEELSGTRFLQTPGPRASLRRIEDAVGRYAALRQRPLLIFDEAQLLHDAELLDMLPLLLNLLPGASGYPVALLFVGEGQLLRTISRNATLNSRVSVRCQLRALTQSETEQYVGQRLQAAGCPRQIFTRAAWPILWQLSGGIPRRINRLCDLALLIGYAESHDQITPELLDNVQAELLPLAA